MPDKVDVGLAAVLVAVPVPVGAYLGQLQLRARAEREDSVVEAAVGIVVAVMMWVV